MLLLDSTERVGLGVIEIIDSMDDAARIERLLNQYDTDAVLFEELCYESERLLKKVIELKGVPISSITSRVKERYSFEQKVRRDKKGKYSSARSVTDIAGARVVTYFEDDVELVANIIKDNFAVDPKNSVNKSRSLSIDRFGYRSVHFVVSLSKERLALPENHKFASLQIEIQVRSLLQHAWAEIEHGFGYKSESNVPASVKRRFSRLSGLLELADEEFIVCRKASTALRASLGSCREEGLTELIGDVRFDIPYSLLAAEADVANRPLLLFLNTNITNRVLDKEGSTEVRLYVEDGSGPAESAKGRQASANGLSFSGVFPLVPTPKRETITVCVSGLRANVCALGPGSAVAPSTVKAHIGMGRPEGEVSGPVKLKAVTALAEPIDVVQVSQSFVFESSAIDPVELLPIRRSITEGKQNVAFRCSFRPLFPGVFRAKHGESSQEETGVSQGTRLMIRFSGINKGIRVFVGTREWLDSAAPCFQLTKSDANGNGQFAPVLPVAVHDVKMEVPGDAVELLGLGSSRMAVWECERAMPAGQAATFLVYFEVESAAQSSTISVNGTFAPLSTVGTASSGAPLPRFADNSLPVILLELVP